MLRLVCLLLVVPLSACSSHGAASDGGMQPGGDLSTGGDLATGGTSDGTPTRQSCTSHYGTALSTSHGRLDGYLTTVLAPGQGQQCNGDSSHVHLQVSMNGGIYDVAVDIGQSGDEIAMYTLDGPLPDGAWAEGWHTSDALSYVSLGVSSSMFTQKSPSSAASAVEDALANANHVSIYGTGYNDNGMHLIHYENGKDGAIVLDPLASTAHMLLFRFQADTF